MTLDTASRGSSRGKACSRSTSYPRQAPQPGLFKIGSNSTSRAASSRFRSMRGNSAHTFPLPKGEVSAMSGPGLRDRTGWLAAQLCDGTSAENSLADLRELIEIWPGTGEANYDATRADDNFCCDLNDARPPRACEPFSEWIACATAVQETLAIGFVEHFGRQGIEDAHFDGSFFRKSCRLTQPNQQVERRRVQIEAEVVGQEAVIAKPVGLQFTFQFLVAILAFTTLCILIICRLRFHHPAESIRNHGPPIGSLGVGFDFDDDRSRRWPRVRLVLDRQEQALRRLGFRIRFHGLRQQI